MDNLTSVTVEGTIAGRGVDKFDLAYTRLIDTKNVTTVDAAFDVQADTYAYLIGVAPSDLGVEHTVSECVWVLKRIGLNKPEVAQVRELAAV
jgi:hypothetical protein